MTTNASHPTSFAAVALALALVAVPTAAQNDDVGIGKSEPTGPSSSDSSNSSSQSVGQLTDTLSIGGDVDEAAADAVVASVSVSRSDGGTLDVVAADPDDESVVVTAAGADPLDLEITPDGDAIVQGHGSWTLPLGLDVTMHAATQAQVRGAFLLVHQHVDGDVPALADVLVHGSGVDQILVLGDLGHVDVAKFEQLAHRFDDELPGLALTWVFASVDAQGGQHVSALRATASGGPVEILTQ